MMVMVLATTQCPGAVGWWLLDCHPDHMMKRERPHGHIQLLVMGSCCTGGAQGCVFVLFVLPAFPKGELLIGMVTGPVLTTCR